jgi:hypothetical protein
MIKDKKKKRKYSIGKRERHRSEVVKETDIEEREKGK